MASIGIRNEQCLCGILLQIVFEKSAHVGGKYQNVGGKLKMMHCSVGGKWSEEYICENCFLTFFRDHETFRCYYCTFPMRGHSHMKWILNNMAMEIAP